MGNYKDLQAFKKSYELAMDIFHLSTGFPAEEKYSLISQLRRSSRSVCANLTEAYKRRRFKAYLVSKLSDAEAENGETELWLNFALDCGYIDPVKHAALISRNTEIGKLIWYMINHPDKFM